MIPTFLRLRAGDRFVRGPWHLGRWSRPIGTSTEEELAEVERDIELAGGAA